MDTNIFPVKGLEDTLWPDISELTEKVYTWLEKIYENTDWRCVLIDNDIERKYHGSSVICYFKALVLPFLVSIANERALGRLILQNARIRELCGFPEIKKKEYEGVSNSQKIFGERSIWHFRNKYQNIYPAKMAKVLISIVLGGKYPNFNLPFVQQVDFTEFSINGNIVDWQIDEYRSPITIIIPFSQYSDLELEESKKKFDDWEITWKNKLVDSAKEGDFGKYRELVKKYEIDKIFFLRKEKKGFIKELYFPINVTTKLISGENIFFKIFKPDWLLPTRDYITDTIKIDTRIPTQKFFYDKACNIIVIREFHGKKEVLLSQRRRSDGTAGEYAVPGGKQRGDETLEECAIRELKEETNLEIIKSRPVSIYITHKDYMQNKAVMSVGVLVDEWIGELKTLEPNKHCGWMWYDFSDLPKSLFEFSKIAINQYVDELFSNIDWSDVEETHASQLDLFSLFENDSKK